MENSHWLERVQSSEGKAARDALIEAAQIKGIHLQCSGKSFVPHIQFRRTVGERPYPFALALNSEVPTFYVRRPGHEKEALLSEFEGAHIVQDGEVKIPTPNARVAKAIADRFFR